MERLIRTLATKACCNRCATFYRWHRDLTDHLKAVAFQLTLEGLEEERKSKARDRVRKLCQVIVLKVEDHFLISGCAQHADEYANAILDNPAAVEIANKMLLRGMREMAIETHHRKAAA
jgi:hypothetical protein